MRVSWFFLTIFLCILGLRSSDVPIKRPPEQGLAGLPVRSLKSLSSSPLTALVATVDGTINLVDSDTGRVIWSFNSGAPIHSSYQAPAIDHDNDTETLSEPDHSFYVDVEDDWELYAYHSYLPKVKLKASIDDYVRSTPLISNDDRSITLGSRKSTVFEVDAATGRLLRTYSMSDYRSASTINPEVNVLYNEDTKDLVESGSNTEQRLKITRTDYSLQSFAQKSGSLLWNLTVAEIGASLICLEDEDSLGKASTDSRLQLGSDSGDPFALPLSCQSSAIVYRLRNHDGYGSLSHSQSYKFMPLLGPSSGGLLPQHGYRDYSLQLQPGNQMLPPLDLLVPSETIMDGSREFHDGSKIALMLSPPAPEVYNSGVANVSNEFLGWSSGLLLLVIVPTLVGFVYYTVDKARENADRVQDSNLKTPSRKKKPRKSGKSSNGSPESKEKHFLTENGDGLTYGVDEDDAWKKLNRIVAGSLDGRRIGKLCVSNSEIAKGSNGTIVLEGIYEGRPVAVKRLVKAHYDVAIKEIENLIASDRHPNIVRWYGLEDDQDFVYVALERCMCSLDDLIQISSDSANDSVFPEDPSSRAMVEYKVRLDSLKNTLQGLDLWKPNGHPSPLLIKLMRDVVSGIIHLHDLGIIHRDLKPQNVLINKERLLGAKVSDMGISKRLRADMSSLGYHVTCCGSSGWQAPEQLQNGRQTRAVDVFSLGCVLFFCITGGRHPFGDRFERDLNIMKNKLDLFLVEFIPEAVDLFSRLLNPDPEMRPKAMEVLHHPLFWSSEHRLSFLRDMSDRVELEDRETESDLLNALESTSPLALGGKWDEKMESLFINNIGRYRRYKYDSVRDLLRVMRNKLNHYRELPKEIQELLGPLPEGFENYFARRFPNLLIEVYKVACAHCKDEECFRKYFRGEQL